MRDIILTYLPWLLSAITIWMTVMAGRKHRNAWAIGLVAQAGWLAWIVTAAEWGFLPMNIALWIAYGVNHWKWAGDKS